MVAPQVARRPPGCAGYILNVLKEAGPTSHDVVAQVRRIAGEPRVGHAGTLDPAAAGVLVVCVGAATRLSEFFLGHDKMYAAEVVFGVATDTYDADGAIVATGGRLPDEPALRDALGAFVGEHWQQPPRFSAIKRGGQPLYRQARAGGSEVAPPRRVTIHSLHLERWRPPAAQLFVHCSAGTYVRSLAHDAGQRLGCGAYLHRLVRIASGPFTLTSARTLGEWADAFATGAWPAMVEAPDRALLDWPALLLDAAGEGALSHGMPLGGRAPRAGEPRCARAYNRLGELVGLLRWEEERGLWRPTKVLR